MIYAVNVDPRFPEGTTDFERLKSMGIQGVAVVSRPDTHQYCWDAQQAGLHVLARIDSSSNGHMVPANVYQIGNEPDIQSESSWTMTPADWIKLWNQYRYTYPDLTMIGPGLASGNPLWWRQVSRKIFDCAGVSVHPYAKNAAQAIELIKQYADTIPRRPVWITEWNRPPSQIEVFTGMLGGACVYAAWYGWSDAMAPDMGLVDGAGTLKMEGWNLEQAIGVWNES